MRNITPPKSPRETAPLRGKPRKRARKALESPYAFVYADGPAALYRWVTPARAKRAFPGDKAMQNLATGDDYTTPQLRARSLLLGCEAEDSKGHRAAAKRGRLAAKMLGARA